jgi:signal peptidase I
MAAQRKLAKTQSQAREGSSWLEVVKTLVYAALIALGVRTIAFEPFNIPSGSMIPTLLIGDFIFVSKYSYGYSRFSIPFAPPLFGWSKTGRILGSVPHRGDVVVFRETHDTSTNFVKRVIGLPGDHIQVKQGQLYINGQEVPREPVGEYEVPDNETGTHMLDKEYVESLPNGPKHYILKVTDEVNYQPSVDLDPNNTPEYVVPENDLFMMGDNRDNSEDSRFQNELGFVPLENVVGRAQFIFFSYDAEHPWWQFWYWPFDIRYSRLLKGVD